MPRFGRLFLNTALATIAVVGAAQAGGFQRGTADTDILFESGTVNFRAGLTHIDPRRGYESINGVEGEFGEYTGTYNIPSFAIGAGNEVVGCAFHYTESFAADADYSGSPGGALPSQNAATQSTSNADRLNLTSGLTSRTETIGFDSDEFGATCRVSYSADVGRFSLLGGVFFEDFEFRGSSLGERSLNVLLGPQLGGALNRQGTSVILPTEVSVNSRGDYEAGYRLGLAYEKPEIALRIQGIYRSEIEHDSISGGGTFDPSTAFVRLANGATVSVPVFLTNPALGLTPAQRAQIGGTLGALGSSPALDVDSSLNTAISPQSFTLNAQTGIAEGTLLLASLRWTDWSTNDAVVSTINGTLAGQAFTSSSYAPYNWRDGYTASLGIGRAFNEFVSGAISVGYDRGVSTGSETTYTDLYTLAGGFSFKDNKLAELRVGGLIGYWTDGEQRIEDGAYFDGEVGNDWIYGATASVKFNF